MGISSWWSEIFTLKHTKNKKIKIFIIIIIKLTPISLLIGHTSVVNCLAKSGVSKDEEYLVSSSENG